MADDRKRQRALALEREVIGEFTNLEGRSLRRETRKNARMTGSALPPKNQRGYAENPVFFEWGAYRGSTLLGPSPFKKSKTGGKARRFDQHLARQSQGLQA